MKTTSLTNGREVVPTVSSAASRARSCQALIEENLLDAVVGLLSNLFFAGIPAAILIFPARQVRRHGALY